MANAPVTAQLVPATTSAAVAAPATADLVVNPSLHPSSGDVTFQSEGQEGGPYHSRKLHVPSGTSGLTIGRGYDMGGKSATQIILDLTNAGMSADDAKTLAKAHGLRGKAAENFIKTNKLEKFAIGSDVQIKLFDISYADEQSEVVRISSKQDVVTKYGQVDFDTIDPALKDLMVDLKFRGDYTGHSRTLLQKAFVENDLKKVQGIMGNTKNWPGVPSDRFKRRKALIDKAVENAANQNKPTVKLP